MRELFKWIITLIVATTRRANRFATTRKLVVEVLSLRIPLALGAQLVKDINTEVDFKGSGPEGLVQVGSNTFFWAITAAEGRALWKSDGTSMGTTLVKDIYLPVPTSGENLYAPSKLTNVNNVVYFTANDGVTGNELWKSDGTSEGTVLLKDFSSIVQFPFGGPRELTNANGVLFFIANDGTAGYELWKTDGTSDGTVLVRDIRPGSEGSSPRNLTNVNGTLYFSANDGQHGYELWRSDGTVAGTVLVKDIRTGTASSAISSLTELNGAIFFEAFDDANGGELWRSDGTNAGTLLVKDIRQGSFSSSPSKLTSLNGSLYFTSVNPISGNSRDLWKSDGTAAGTTLVKEFPPEVNNFGVTGLTSIGGTLFLQANDGTHGEELWKSDGTTGGTVMVKDIRSGNSSANIAYLTNVNGTLLFRANDGTMGVELWKSDGTESGTVMIKDIWSGVSSGVPGMFVPIDQTLYFAADDGTHGLEIWKSDGSSAGTLMVKDIRSGTSDASPAIMTDVNGTLFFRANDGVHGTELWKSDGTVAGTTLVSDILHGSGGSTPGYLTNVNGTLYFTTNDGANGTELWKSDGTNAGTLLVKNIRSGSQSSYPRFLSNVNGQLYFWANDGTSGVELWRSDGTSTGTVLVRDINTGISSTFPMGFAIVNNEFYFAATDGSNGYELWKTDGTNQGTVIVKEIRSGNNGQITSPRYLTNINGMLFFASYNGTSSDEIWKSDGTEVGTNLIRAFSSGVSERRRRYLTNVNGVLYFQANDGTSGYELWKSDGTTAGTVLVKDIRLGNQGSDPSSLVNVDGLLFFNSNDGVYGQELWKTDGTSTGTVMVKDLSVGSSGSYPIQMKSVNGATYFIAMGRTSQEVWISDGTSLGTKPLSSFLPSRGLLSSFNLLGANNIGGSLYYSATTSEYGTELWQLTDENQIDIELTSNTIVENSAMSTIVGVLTTRVERQGDTFTYSLVPGEGDTDNPTFNISGSNLQVNNSLDFETKSNYTIRVRSTDQNGKFIDRVFAIEVIDANETPLSVQLSNALVGESLPIGALIGLFSTSDPDLMGAFSYALVLGVGSDDNLKFILDDNQLRSATVFDFESKSNYTVRIRSTDQGGLSTEKIFTVSIKDLNEAPLSVQLNNAIVDEGLAVGTEVGTLSTSDPDSTDAFFYTLVAGTGGDDNNQFTVSGNGLRTNSVFDYQSKSSYSVRVRSTDKGNLSTESVLRIDVRDKTRPILVSVERFEALPNPINGSELEFVATFSEAITGGSTSSFVVVGETTAGISAVTSLSPTSYLVKVSGGDLDRFNGLVKIALSSSATIQDLSGNALQSSIPSVDEAFLVDHTSPEVTVDPQTANRVRPSISGSVSDATALITVTVAGRNYTAVNDGNGQWSLNGASLIDPLQAGRNEIAVSARDAAGNIGRDSTSQEILVILQTPTDLQFVPERVHDQMDSLTSDILFGQLNAKDLDPVDQLSFQLIPGVGDQDNSSFFISGNSIYLRKGQILNYDTKPQYSVRVQASDLAGNNIAAPIQLRLQPLPVAKDDKFALVQGRQTVIDVKANDLAPDNNLQQLTIRLLGQSSSSIGTIEVTPDNRILLTANSNAYGVLTVNYRLSDPRGGESRDAKIQFGVTRSPKQNPWFQLDVNDNGLITPSDALLIINVLNDPTSERLVPDGLPAPEYLDINGDNRISPSDALVVINYLNSRTASEGESSVDYSDLTDLEAKAKKSRLRSN